MIAIYIIHAPAVRASRSRA